MKAQYIPIERDTFSQTILSCQQLYEQRKKETARFEAKKAVPPMEGT